MSTDLEKYVADILKYLGFLLIIPLGKMFGVLIYGEGKFNVMVFFTAIVALLIALLFFYIGYRILKRRSYVDDY